MLRHNLPLPTAPPHDSGTDHPGELAVSLNLVWITVLGALVVGVGFAIIIWTGTGRGGGDDS